MTDSGESISGVVERITFHNLDNGYAVLKVQAGRHRGARHRRRQPVQRRRRRVHRGRGQWVDGPRPTACSSRPTSSRTTPPHTPQGIEKYLGSGLIKGIGPHYAKRIVEVFGERTLDVIDE